LQDNLKKPPTSPLNESDIEGDDFFKKDDGLGPGKIEEIPWGELS